MTLTRKRLLMGVLLGVLGAEIFGGRALHRQQSEWRKLEANHAMLVRECEALRQQENTTKADLAAAERQLAELPATRPQDPLRAREISSWYERLKKLRQLFVDKPETRIPELQLLTEDDWLRVTSHVQLDSEDHIRQALAAVRDVARDTFERLIAHALTDYVKQSKGDLPPTVFALAPFFETPVDPALLERYEMVAAGKVADLAAGKAAIQEKAPIDPRYDSRWEIMANGGGRRTPAPGAWVPNFQERSRKAYDAFRSANHGVNATAVEQVVPYFDPPLEPTLAENLIKAGREHGW